MKKTLTALASATAALAILTACGSSDESKEETRFPLSGLQNYDDPQQLVADLNEGGFACEDYQRTSGSMNAASTGECWAPQQDDDRAEVIIMIFNAETNKQTQESLYRQTGEIIGTYGFVEGGNWMVNCGTPTVCTEVQKVIGGRKETKPTV